MGRKGVWLVVVSMLAGALLVPRVAAAVGSVVSIQGGSGTQKANVTKGHQLQTAEAPPSSFRVFEASLGQTSCTVFVTAPATRGLVLKSITIDVQADSSGVFPLVLVYPNASCTGPEIIASATTTQVGQVTFPFEPGFAVAPGHKLGVKVPDTSVSAVYATGYVVPANDVPTTTPVEF